MSAAPDTHDAALGAVMGALVGDAAGAVLEFLRHAPGDEEVAWALTFPGGGTLRVAPGQITDDGELTLCLMHALDEAGFDDDTVATWYGRWLQSSPFDIGGTTQSGLAPAQGHRGPGLAERMRAAARAASPGSKANGSLMRCTPLAVWGHRLDDAALAALARRDSALTHPNDSCCDAVAAYVIAIAHLVGAPGDRAGAVGRVQAWVDAHAVDEVREWLAMALRGEGVPYRPQIGFVKIAFVHAFRHLHAGTGYIEALSETLRGGGDTDTNACIVGGLIGAAVGADAIPMEARQAVLTSDLSRGRPRPAFLHPGQVPALVERLLASAPASIPLQ